MTATVCVLLTSCFFLLTFSTTLVTSQTWNLPFGSSSSLRTMFRNPNMLSSSLGDPPSRGQMVIPVTRGVVGVRNQLSPMQQEIRQRQQQLAQLQQQNAQHSLRVRTQPSGQFDRSRDVAPPTFAQTADAQQFNPNDYRGQDNMAFLRDFQQQQQHPRQVQRRQMSEAGLQYEGPQSVDYKQLQRDQQQRFPRRKISEEPQLPFSPYSDTFAHRVHSNRVGEQVFTEANPYITGPEPPVHPNLRQQSFQSREDTIPQVNPSKRAFEQGNQQVQQNSLTSPYQGLSGSQTNFVAPPIPGQQMGIMHSGQAVPTYQAVPGSPGMVYQVHPNQVMAQPPFPPSGPNVPPNFPQNFVAGPVQQQTHLYTQPQPGQQPQYSAIPGVPSGPFPNVPQSGGAGGSVAQGVPAYSMPNPMAMYSMNPGGMGMAMQPPGMGMPMSGGGVGMPFSNPMFGMPMGGFPFWMDMESPDSPDPVQPAAPAPPPAAAPASPTLTSQPVNTAPQVPQTAAAQPLSTLPQAPVPAAVAIPTPVVSDVAAPIAAVPVQTGSGSGAGPSPVQVQSGTPTITAPATVVASGTSAAASGTLPSGPASSPVHPSEGAAAAASPAVASNPVQGQQSHAAAIPPDAASHPGTVASEGSKMAVNASTSNLQQTTESPTSSTTEEYEAEEYEYEDGTTTSATTTTTIRITTAPPPTPNPMLAISGLVKAEFGKNNSNQGGDVGGSHGVAAAPVFIYFLPKYGNSSGHDVASPVLVNLARVGQDLMPLLNIGDLVKGFSLVKQQQQLQQKQQQQQQQHIKATSAIGTTVNPPSQILSTLINVLSAASIKRSSDVVVATPLPVMATPPGVLVSDVYKSHRSPSSSETASTSVTGSGTTGSYPKEWQTHFDYFFKLYYSLGGTSPQPPAAHPVM